MRKILLVILFSASPVNAAERIVNLSVDYKKVNFSGRSVNTVAINNQIPAPTLHFKENDHVTIRVTNHLREETALHWHGVLVPWQMDGVLGINQQGIQPGQTFQYQFTLKQSGTYWYHAHAEAQEQDGIYGAFIIDPVHTPNYHYTKDFTIVLSDWSNSKGEKVFANLKKDGSYYSPNFPLQPSLQKFLQDYRHADHQERQQLLSDYQMMQTSRMNIYDINDVAYDAFLLNGFTQKNPWTALVKVGDVVRLRFIAASGETIFHIKIPDATMKIIHIQGNDIRPYTANQFTIAPGETYDVLVKILNNKPYVIYAESADKVGFVYGILKTQDFQKINPNRIERFPEPLPVTREMMHNSMPAMNHDDMEGMDMSEHQYQNVIASVKTNDPTLPIHDVINMELFGYMDRFIWMINGLPEYRAKPIILEPAKRYRFVFKNNSMMHHPMHFHGHWFILRNGHGEYDPLLHTIDVPPGSTIVTDVDTDASGQWFFHCHMLYHMMSGMARPIQYSSLLDIVKDEKKPQNIVKNGKYINRPIIRVDEARPINQNMVHHPQGHHEGFYFSNYLELSEDPFHNTQEFSFKGLYGGDYNKLELLTEDAEVNQGNVEFADLDIFYWHLLNQFWSIKGGANYTYRPAVTPYWQPGVGLEGVMPYFIDTNLRGYYHAGSLKLDLELDRDTQITNNFFIRLGVRGIAATKTVSAAEIGSGMNQARFILRPFYRIAPGINLYLEYEHQQNYGAFRKMQINAGESSVDNNLFLGFSVLF
jgi:FtsP/CotA-like multicopper oxidase with cupredoxin domain